MSALTIQAWTSAISAVCVVKPSYSGQTLARNQKSHSCCAHLLLISQKLFYERRQVTCTCLWPIPAKSQCMAVCKIRLCVHNQQLRHENRHIAQASRSFWQYQAALLWCTWLLCHWPDSLCSQSCYKAAKTSRLADPHSRGHLCNADQTKQTQCHANALWSRRKSQETPLDSFVNGGSAKAKCNQEAASCQQTAFSADTLSLQSQSADRHASVVKVCLVCDTCFDCRGMAVSKLWLQDQQNLQDKLSLDPSNCFLGQNFCLFQTGGAWPAKNSAILSD